MTTISRTRTRARLLTSKIAVVVILVAPLIWKHPAEGSSSGVVGPIAVTEIPTDIRSAVWTSTLKSSCCLRD
jgi:hypothetical protein